MSYVVVVADRIAEAGLELLSATPELEVIVTAGEAHRLPEALARAHGLIVRSDTTVTEDLLAQAPHLSVVGRAGVGVDNIDLEAATRRGIAVLNVPGANTVSAAEHAMALLLALLRRIPWAAESMRAGAWDRKRFPGTELRGKRLGIVGLGRVGLHVAAIGKAFGMRVRAYDPYLPEDRAADAGVTLVPLEQLLREADVVTLHLPLTNETQHLMDAERLALMKPTAVLVNTARGGLLDDEALLEAVEQGRLAGAALDVFDPEPLPADSPLRTSERILLTPHLAASTAEAQERVAAEISANVRNALIEGTLRGAVNLPGISSDTLTRLAGVLDLARRLGRLAAGLAHRRVRAVEVIYGGDDDAAPKPAMLAALEGVLSALGVGAVSLVNAASRAADRGVTVERRVGQPLPGFETTVGVIVQGADGLVRVDGTLLGDRAGRVVRIDGHPVDVPAEGDVIVVRNRDVPGVIGRVGTALGAASVNIASYHQSRRPDETGYALAAIVVDQLPERTVLEALAGEADVVDVRYADLDGPA
ncbi:MAG: phosphoglycerate dehydrogenase [Gemmatimonadales bacterium]